MKKGLLFACCVLISSSLYGGSKAKIKPPSLEMEVKFASFLELPVKEKKRVFHEYLLYKEDPEKHLNYKKSYDWYTDFLQFYTVVLHKKGIITESTDLNELHKNILASLDIIKKPKAPPSPKTPKTPPKRKKKPLQSKAPPKKEEYKDLWKSAPPSSKPSKKQPPRPGTTPPSKKQPPQTKKASPPKVAPSKIKPSQSKTPSSTKEEEYKDLWKSAPPKKKNIKTPSSSKKDPLKEIPLQSKKKTYQDLWESAPPRKKKPAQSKAPSKGKEGYKDLWESAPPRKKEPAQSKAATPEKEYQELWKSAPSKEPSWHPFKKRKPRKNKKDSAAKDKESSSAEKAPPLPFPSKRQGPIPKSVLEKAQKQMRPKEDKSKALVVVPSSKEEEEKSFLQESSRSTHSEPLEKRAEDLSLSHIPQAEKYDWETPANTEAPKDAVTLTPQNPWDYPLEAIWEASGTPILPGDEEAAKSSDLPNEPRVSKEEALAKVSTSRKKLFERMDGDTYKKKGADDFYKKNNDSGNVFGNIFGKMIGTKDREVNEQVALNFFRDIALSDDEDFSNYRESLNEAVEFDLEEETSLREELKGKGISLPWKTLEEGAASINNFVGEELVALYGQGDIPESKISSIASVLSRLEHISKKQAESDLKKAIDKSKHHGSHPTGDGGALPN